MEVALARALLTVPRRVFEFFPTGLLLGALLGLGNLAARNELLAVRGFGWSIWRLAGAVMWIGVPLSAAVLLLGEFGVPAAERILRAAESGRVSVGTEGDLWVREGHRFVNVARFFPDGHLRGVWVYDLDDSLALRRVTWIGRASYDESRRRWRLETVTQTDLRPDGIERRRFRELHWDSLVSLQTLDLVAEDPQRMPARRLHDYVAHLKASGLDASRYEVALWSRLATPFTVLPLLLMAVPFAFGPLRGAGAGQRLFVGVVIGVVFHLLREALANVAVVYGWSPWAGVALPLAGLTGVALWMLRRAN
jgi:lipopolysaccharide export system permease protein